ncbi:MAG: serine hydrolase [Alphaproteobacteria bacterium]|nr:serine hydrolase [Alphaproteobacteria bacterium]
MRRASMAALLGVFILLAGLTARADDLTPYPAQDPAVPYPTATWPEAPAESPARQAVEALLTPAFEGTRPPALARTKAVLVVQRGMIVAERYAAAIARDTRLQSWSMAKSFLHATLGLAIADGKLNPSAPAPVTEWKTPGDSRKSITLRQLAQMTDGLAFREDYGDANAEAMQMLFGRGRGDVGTSAATARSAAVPGTRWSYSSGSANILSRILRDTAGGREAYRAFLQQRLFAPLGIKSAVPEFDASGTWIGSSYVHATARDFARFGLLYLRGGAWEGRQIVPREWIDIARTPTMASKGEYGALFWLNARNPDTGNPAIAENIPEDTFLARGFGGQLITIVPSRDAIVVMLNAAYTDDNKPIVNLVANVLSALPH